MSHFVELNNSKYSINMVKYRESILGGDDHASHTYEGTFHSTEIYRNQTLSFEGGPNLYKAWKKTSQTNFW
jgi:hypothetical protein